MFCNHLKKKGKKTYFLENRKMPTLDNVFVSFNFVSPVMAPQAISISFSPEDNKLDVCEFQSMQMERYATHSC